MDCCTPGDSLKHVVDVDQFHVYRHYSHLEDMHEEANGMVTFAVPGPLELDEWLHGLACKDAELV